VQAISQVGVSEKGCRWGEGSREGVGAREGVDCGYTDVEAQMRVGGTHVGV